MFARATIEANRSRGISVPRSAVLYRTEGPSVQVVRGDVIETRLVHVGYHSDTDTEIRDGLREGDLVVRDAGSSLRTATRLSGCGAARRDDVARGESRTAWFRPRGLFGKYVVAFVGLVVFVLAVNGALETWFTYNGTIELLAKAQSEKADAVARRIQQFIEEIERQ
jgi:hypothetical protein